MENSDARAAIRARRDAPFAAGQRRRRAAAAQGGRDGRCSTASRSRSSATSPSATSSPHTPIAKGEIIVKYSCPIGTATAAIAPGDYVHTHNVESNYLPTYTLPEIDAMLQAIRAPTAARASATSRSSPISSSARTTSRAASPRRFRERGVHLIGFPGCYPNAYALDDAGEALHASQRRRRAARVARLRRLRHAGALATRHRGLGPAGAHDRDPGDRRHDEDDRRRTRVDRADAARARRASARCRWASTS